MNISLITVNYKNTRITKRFINSLEECYNSEKIKIYIIDNHSTQKSKSELIEIKNKSFLNIHLEFNSENFFYWPAVGNLLSKIYCNQVFPEWTIICNNDIIFNQRSLFDKLQKLDGDLFNLIGPSIESSQNKDLNPFLKKDLNLLHRIYWKVYFKSYFFANFLNALRKFSLLRKRNKEEIYKSKHVYAVHGSFIFFSRYFFIKGGYLDKNFKLYCEELTTAEISRKIGCKIFHIPELRVFHNNHSSTKKMKKKLIFELAKESHNYFIRKYK